MKAPSIVVFEPALCCSTGVCGPEVDESLLRFAADVDWLKREGVQVLRYNLRHDANAFAQHPLVRRTLQRDGMGCLPLILVDGEIISRGAYPPRHDLAKVVRMTAQETSPSSRTAPSRDFHCATAPRGRVAAEEDCLNPVQDVVRSATRFLFFTGKGGVGKTSHACATALALADGGRRVLLVSTDPASNLSEVLGAEIGDSPEGIPDAPELWAMNIDPEAAAAVYRERAIEPARDLLPDAAIRQMEEQLSGACTVEVAAFDKFAALLVDDEKIGGFDHVIFDTAPTGHTLRLLQLPAAWSSFLEQNERGASCLGPVSGHPDQRRRYAAAVRTLTDPSATTLVLVSRPEREALAEAERTHRELAALGISQQRLILNGVFRASDPEDELALAIERRGRDALDALPATLAALPRVEVRLEPHNLVGLEALRALSGDSERKQMGSKDPAAHARATDLPSVSNLVDEIAEAEHGLVMIMGKGGVGKTSIAAAVAVELAARGIPVHLSTTDPAAHLSNALAGEVEGLRVTRIDPQEEVRAYSQRVMNTSGEKLDADGRALLAEDLRSPCTEEVAVFHAFSRIVNEARRGVVVLDTAPTGHTLLLLDTTGAYHRETMRTSRMPPERVTTPMTRLRNPEHTRILIVTLPETTPVSEAERLQSDLRRAGIEPYAWVVNQSLAAAEPTDPVLVERARQELPLIDRIRSRLARRLAVVPVLMDAPVGQGPLRAMARGTRASAAAIGG